MAYEYTHVARCGSCSFEVENVQHLIHGTFMVGVPLPVEGEAVKLNGREQRCPNADRLGCGVLLWALRGRDVEREGEREPYGADDWVVVCKDCLSRAEVVTELRGETPSEGAAVSVLLEHADGSRVRAPLACPNALARGCSVGGMYWHNRRQDARD